MNLRRHIFAGLFTIVPLWITWLVLRFLFNVLIKAGSPAVYVPTTPNPTSGYLEIVPLDRVTSTDWSLDDAMAFIMSGGAVAPDSMNYDQLTAKKE
jgi:uncharacterized membrane protein